MVKRLRKYRFLNCLLVSLFIGFYVSNTLSEGDIRVQCLCLLCGGDGDRGRCLPYSGGGVF